MDASPTYVLRPKPSRKRLLSIIAGLALVILAVVAAYFFIWKKAEPMLSGQQKLLLVPKELPLFAIAVLDTGSGNITPLSLKAAGTASIIGYAHGANANFYILSEVGGKQSNIYRGDPRNMNAGLSQVTHTPGIKLDLSVDPQNGDIAFITLRGTTTPVISVLAQGTTTPKEVDTGHSPVIMPGGTYVVFEKDNVLYSVNVLDRTRHRLVTIPKGGSFAVDAKGQRIVIFDPPTQSLQYFSIRNSLSASAEMSKKSLITNGSQALVLSGKGTAQILRTKDGLALPVPSKPGLEKFVLGSGAFAGALITTYDD